ncbi:hypothetical protein B0H10DRAFT_2160830 [Mycena sp. CBHHK59/15]|nr:hypothetical protein B0H10DRAFT_2160830 [Mycena sp. CBHHK59/15]
MQVTISRLPTTVSIVSIPRPRLSDLSHPVLRCLLQPQPAFLSITCNELELSLFADHHLLHDFDHIAAADADRQRHAGPDAGSAQRAPFESIEVSHDRWSVLQIDSHSDQLDNAGARVNELSAPLAAAGISILYQSSYMSDFLFVKEQRLDEAMALFSAAGFALYTSDPNLLTHHLDPPSPTSSVLTRSGPESPHPKSRSKSKSKSHSPLSRDVRVLAPDLTCVGLADDSADHWALKIVKLVAFPDLIPGASPLRKRRRPPSPSPPPPLRRPSPPSPTLAADDGYFSHSPSPPASDSEPEKGDPVPPSRAQPVPSRLAALPDALAWPPPDTEFEPESETAVPFFSFTRTPEGSSLTASARVLAALFPRAERHMVICSSELDAADAALGAPPASPSSPFSPSSPSSSATPTSSSPPPEDDDDAPGLLTCLQVDLRRFGLDKHGLVHTFSRVLGAAGVNHMYSSTFRSANLLVGKRHAARAGVLLSGC